MITPCFRRLRVVLAALLLVPATLFAQFSPATGNVATSVMFNQGTGTQNSGAFSVTRTNADPFQLRITRPGLGDLFITENCQLGATCQLSYAFVGPEGLLIRFTQTDTVTSLIRLSFVNMATHPAGQPATGLINATEFVSEQPNLSVFRNSDGLVIFTHLLTGPANLRTASNVTLWRGDTGAALCGAGTINLSSGDTLAASVSGTGVTITRSGNNIASCALPAPDLTLSPDPLAFGQIVSNTTDTRTVTLANPGTDPITVTAMSSSGHFAPQGFAPVTIPGGGSTTATILFNPGGAAGNFNETLTITRIPAVGDDTLACTGSSVAPVPNIQLAPAALNFGTVNVGNNPTATFRIRNTGQLDLVVNTVTAPGNAAYALAAPAGFATPFTLAPGGETGLFTVTFSPTAPGPVADTITVASNDPDSPNVTLALNGTGHVPAADFFLDPTLTNLAYGDVEIGYRFGKPIRIVNRGDLDLVFDVEVLGDARFTFSQNANTPGPGVRGPVTITIPASPPAGPFNEQILRVTFDAQAPVAANIAGTLRISNIVNDPTPPPQPIDVALSGNVVAAQTLDIALVIDRSGSMNEPTASGTKVQAVRSASELFFNLLRDNVADRAAIVQFNTAANVLQPMTAMPPATRQTFINIVTDPNNLAPSGATSISAGLVSAFGQLTDVNRQVRAVLIVSDGKENTDTTVNGQPVNLSNFQVPAGIGVNSLALGTAQNTDLARLTDIANRTGGTAMATDNVTQLGVFDVEKYFLQVATTITGGTTTLDPVSTINPGQVQTWQVELIPADKAVTFVLMFKDGTLPYRVIAPDGTHYPNGSPPNGIGESATVTPNAKILRLSLPSNQPSAYIGPWRIQVMHGGKIERQKGDQRTTETHTQPVTYAVAVSVNSNLRLLPLLSAQPLHPGDPITVTGFLTEEEVPVRGATIDVSVRLPNAAAWGTLTLHDDGAHNDGAANDGEYANLFTATTQAGAYTFTYHATGTSARGGAFVREATLSQFVQPVNPPPGGDDPGGGGSGSFAECCAKIVFWLRIVAILIVIAVVVWVLLRRRGP